MSIRAMRQPGNNAKESRTARKRDLSLKPDLTFRVSSSHAWQRNIASRCVTAVALSIALGIPAFSQPSNERAIPFENTGIFGLVVVKVEVNGKAAVLIVDTASNRTIISSEIADVRPRTLSNLVSTRKGSGLSGTGVFARVTLKLAHITWRDHQIVVMDMADFSKSFGQKIDGLLGMDLLSQFELVVVDQKNHKLILQP